MCSISLCETVSQLSLSLFPFLVSLLFFPAALHDDRLTVIGANVCCSGKDVRIRAETEREEKKRREEKEERDLLTLKDIVPNCLRLKM